MVSYAGYDLIMLTLAHLPTESCVQHAQYGAVVEGCMSITYGVKLLPYPGLSQGCIVRQDLKIFSKKKKD